MVNAPQRPDMTPPMQMSAGPPLLSASIHAAAPPAQFAYLQHHGSSYAQVMATKLMWLLLRRVLIRRKV